MGEKAQLHYILPSICGYLFYCTTNYSVAININNFYLEFSFFNFVVFSEHFSLHRMFICLVTNARMFSARQLPNRPYVIMQSSFHFFVGASYLRLRSNYQQIQSLAHDQHEIATETISLQQGLQDKGYEEWVGEMIGMREILRHFSNVSTSDVVGMRAPYLKPGRNAQYKVSDVYDVPNSNRNISNGE